VTFAGRRDMFKSYKLLHNIQDNIFSTVNLRLITPSLFASQTGDHIVYIPISISFENRERKYRNWKNMPNITYYRKKTENV